MSLVEYTCSVCGKARMLKFRPGRVNLNKNCHSCASKIMRASGKSWGMTHGGSGTKLHQVWCGMKQRCSYPKHKNYALYGGRGITICAEWKRSFGIFRAWALKHGYREGLVLDRVNTDGNYEPSNCRWATMLVSNSNKRNNVLSIYDAMVIKDLAWRGVTPKVIAALYNVPTQYVSAIKQGHAWAKIPYVRGIIR